MIYAALTFNVWWSSEYWLTEPQTLRLLMLVWFYALPTLVCGWHGRRYSRVLIEDYEPQYTDQSEYSTEFVCSIAYKACAGKVWWKFGYYHMWMYAREISTCYTAHAPLMRVKNERDTSMNCNPVIIIIYAGFHSEPSYLMCMCACQPTPLNTIGLYQSYPASKSAPAIGVLPVSIANDVKK